MLKPLILLTAFLAISAASLAQAPPSPTPFSGTMVSFNDATVTLKDKDGKTFVVQMTSGWTVSVLRAGDAATIKPGNFVATANAVVDPDTGKSTELRVLEPGYRPEEGTHGVEGSPNMMTHGTVASVSKTSAGVELNVTYPGGSRHIIVPPGVPVNFSDPQDRGALKPGVAVSSVTRKGTDGVARAGRLVLAVAPQTGDLNPLQLSPHHATASVADIEKEAQWYERVLGFRETNRFGAGTDMELRNMTIPGYRIDLLSQRGSRRPAGASDSSRQGWFHVVFRTPAIDAAYKRLVEQGTDVQANRNEQSAITRLVFHDPEGNELEIVPE